MNKSSPYCISARSDNENISDEENDPVVPAKKAKFEEESDHESEGDFAEKLLEGSALSFFRFLTICTGFPQA